jgi:hypothetical protein
MPELSPSRYLVQAGWDSVPHLDEKTKAELLASTPPHLRSARSEGEPSMGAGAIYPLADSDIVCDPFPIPAYFRRGYGLDVGWRMTAAIWCAYDPGSDVIYAYTEHARATAEPSIHAAAIRARGEWIPGFIDPAARARMQTDGRQLIVMYRDLGLKITEADNTISGEESGLYEVWERFSTGRLKIFTTCLNLLQERRFYRRDEKGKIVKVNDHLCLHGDTLVVTRRGREKIADLVGTKGEVLTIGGQWAPYENCCLTQADAELVAVTFDDETVVRCTPDHRFLTEDGWIEAACLEGRMCYVTECESRSYPRQSKSLTESGTGFAGRIFSAMGSVCTARFGRRSMDERRRKGTTFITRMAIGLTTSLTILSCWFTANTSHFISRVFPGLYRLLPSFALPNGIEAMRGELGTLRTGLRTEISFLRAVPSGANSANVNLQPRSMGETGFAPTLASLRRGAIAAWTMLSGGVWSVVTHSRSTATVTQPLAAGSAGLRSLSVNAAGRGDVYCMSVPEYGAFAIENGLIVSNCDALRYGVKARQQFIVEPIKGVGNRASVYHRAGY